MAPRLLDLRTISRLGWGALLLAAPGAALRLLGGEPSEGACKVMRVLGTRHVLQSLVQARQGGRHRYLLAAVDGAHAASALAFAAFDRHWRRPAVTDACLAVVWGATTARLPQPEDAGGKLTADG